MALDTYSNLQTALADHIGNRGDVTAATIRDFITLCEARVRRHLKVRPMVGRATSTVSAGYMEVPADFGGAISFVLTDQSPPVHLEGVSSGQLNDYLAYFNASGVPVYYAVVGAEFGFAPSPGGSYAAQLTYYKNVAALSDTNTFNWLLSSHPDVYLNGALSEAGKYMVDDPRGPVWERQFVNALEDLTVVGIAETFGGKLSVGSTFAP